jgi:hypothetical protein
MAPATRTGERVAGWAKPKRGMNNKKASSRIIWQFFLSVKIKS